MKSPRISSIRLTQRGMARFFGDLEARVMEAVWRLGEATVQDVCQTAGDHWNYKTIMTVLNRLVQKGMLARRKEGRAYVYTPCEERHTFLRRMSQAVIGGLLEDFGELAIAPLMEAAETVDPEQLAELERLLRARVEKGGEPDARVDR